MRRIVLLIFIFVLVLSIAGCGMNKKFNPADVTMDIIEENVTPLGLTVIISNNTKIDIYGGIADDFLIEKEEYREARRKAIDALKDAYIALASTNKNGQDTML